MVNFSFIKKLMFQHILFFHMLLFFLFTNTIRVIPIHNPTALFIVNKRNTTNKPIIINNSLTLNHYKPNMLSALA